MLWWFTHMIRTVRKLVNNAKNAGHSFRRPWDRVDPAGGTLRSNTSNVMANAKMASLNASVLAVPFSSIGSVPVVSTRHRLGQVGFRLEGASGSTGRTPPRAGGVVSLMGVLPHRWR